jgi:glycerol-1-phosphate dehydrogenase [NAD(P)+]
MKLLKEGRPSILHGAKVGVATILVSKLYDQLRQLTRYDAKDLLQQALRPTQEDQAKRIRTAFGTMAEEILKVQSDFLDLKEETYQSLKQRIVESWSEIQSIAAEVPPSEILTELLSLAGGPTSPQAIGLNMEDVALAARNAHYLRRHFTILRLMEFLYPKSGGTPFFVTNQDSLP